MAYDEPLAERIRSVLAHRADLDERKMFGGIAFMLHGNMCCGIVGDDLMLRMAPDDATAALADAHARPMDFTGRPMKGFVYIDPDGTADDADLKDWVTRSVAFADTLPAK